MTGFRDNIEKPEFLTLNPQIKIFFQNSGGVTFFTLLTPNVMQNFIKTNEQSLRYLETDTHTHIQTRGITKVPGTKIKELRKFY